MNRFENWSIKCNLCDWQWETYSKVIAQKPKCPNCGSLSCTVEKNELITIKKEGKIIDEIILNKKDIEIGEIQGDIVPHSIQSDRPLLVIRENDVRFLKNMNKDELKSLLGKIEIVKNKIEKDIRKSD